jgi:hypothetical protein
MLYFVSNYRRKQMDSNPTPSTQYQQVVVDVPEDRVAEFHALFARFLAGPISRRRRDRGGRPHRGHHGRRCVERREATERAEATSQPGPVTEV